MPSKLGEDLVEDAEVWIYTPYTNNIQQLMSVKYVWIFGLNSPHSPPGRPAIPKKICPL